MPVPAFPEFPTNVPTHPLLVIDYELLKNGDKKEMDKLWDAATVLGFWYLKNHGADEDVEKMFDMGAETMDLPMEEKMKYERGNSFGYKFAGSATVDASGEPDRVEFFTIAKDDALAWPKQARRSYPSTINSHMDSTIVPFVKKSIEINSVILDIFNDKLGLPDGMLLKFHSGEYSACEARTIKAPKNLPVGKMALGAHTDFGSLSFLHNRLGGLQVLPPGVEEWLYVKPIPGQAICNVGDALTFLSGGILRSNMHRVVIPTVRLLVPKPALNAGPKFFFTRPVNSLMLRPLSDESPLIAEAVRKLSNEQKEAFAPGMTAYDWVGKRLRYPATTNVKQADARN
ncbi:Clavaminate synthase-like protein [Rhodocollybia butyracea]|uniref:Clavaminate synthase-like protein n=1 Tax=Rhodocollybia butyracea TaxID=206335 RepID=A0A9P5PSR5_9AGAR|nr:Clavaminate synthase-like protein [Rhodocollybia butyracea]